MNELSTKTSFNLSKPQLEKEETWQCLSISEWTINFQFIWSCATTFYDLMELLIVPYQLSVQLILLSAFHF